MSGKYTDAASAAALLAALRFLRSALGRRLRWGSLALLLLGWLASASQAQVQASGPETLRLSQFEQQLPDGSWQPVTLPLSWGLAVPGQARRLHLRTRFELASAPHQMWALMATRMPPDRQVWLNGQLAQGAALVPQTALRRFSLLPQWLELPPSLLRAGPNELALELELNHRVSGLSVLTLGPAVVLRPDFARTRWWTVSLPQGLNTAAAGLALFALLVWWLRRSERVLGYFGALWLLVSLRNVAYYVPGGALPPVLGEYLFFAAQVGSAALLLGFALALARRPWPGAPGRALSAIGVALLLGALAAWQDRMGLARLLGYPVLLGLLVWAAFMIWSSARDWSVRGRWAAALALVLLLAAALHDYLYTTGGGLLWQQVGLAGLLVGTFWIPFISPVILLAAARVLLRRFVGAMTLAEQQGHWLELRVAERTQALEAANAAKTRFVAAASHDLRQPVASIGLLAGLLRGQVQGDGARAVLERLTASVLALEALLKGLLDLSRFDAGSVQLRPQAVPLQPLFNTVLAHEREAAASLGLHLRLRCRGGDRVVLADPVLLEQILRNLVANAVRYTTRGGVLLSARHQAGRVLLQVWDTGCGIAPEQQARVFEEYVQLDNPARERHRGLGLGLSLVQRAAQRMAAPLSLRSVPGRGSCFGVILPAAQHPAAGSPPALATPSSAAWAGRQVLLVDDDDGVREALCLQLQHWGMVVTACASLAEVRQCLGQLGGAASFSLLISDQRLPDGSALEVRALLQDTQPDVPVLVVTGDTGPDELARLEASGLDILHKPFSAAALWASLPDPPV